MENVIIKKNIGGQKEEEKESIGKEVKRKMVEY